MPVAEVRGMVKGFEGQMGDVQHDVQRILQALHIGQKMSSEREHEPSASPRRRRSSRTASPTNPTVPRKRRSQQQMVAASPRRRSQQQARSGPAAGQKYGQC